MPNFCLAVFNFDPILRLGIFHELNCSLIHTVNCSYEYAALYQTSIDKWAINDFDYEPAAIRCWVRPFDLPLGFHSAIRQNEVGIWRQTQFLFVNNFKRTL